VAQWLAVRPPPRVATASGPTTSAEIGGPRWYATVGLLSSIGAVVYLLHTPQVPDLAAQVARAHIAKAGAFLWWDGWFGGMHLPSYSAASPFIMNLIGVQTAAAIAAVVSVVLAADLLRDTPRPRAGTFAFGVAVFADVLGGRVTFALGLAAAVGALVLLRRNHAVLGSLVSASTILFSPLAGLFLGLVLVAVAVVDRERRRPAAAMAITLLALGAALALLFPGSGSMSYPWWHMVLGLVITVGVVLVCPDRRVRTAGICIALTILGLGVVPGAIGSNVLRLVWLVAAPIVVACAQVRGIKLIAAIVALAVWPAIDLGIQLGKAESPSVHESFYTPLVTALAAQFALAGPDARGQRVEVIDPATHWPAAYVAPTFPLARGWYRQADRANNPLFYDGTFTPARYHAWLSSLAVGWVALPINVRLDEAANQEAAAVSAQPSYLRLVWSNQSWRLYRVVDARPLVVGAEIISADKNTVTFQATAPGTVHLQIRWSPYISLTAAKTSATCVERDGAWTAVQVDQPGVYTLGTKFSLIRDNRSSRCSVIAQLPQTAPAG
jgi:hypothetical protein